MDVHLTAHPFFFYSYYLHFSLEPLCNLTEEMVSGVSSIDAMVAIGVGELAEVLVGLDEGFGIFCRVAEMHIVVGQSMTDEQTARKLSGT